MGKGRLGSVGSVVAILVWSRARLLFVVRIALCALWLAELAILTLLMLPLPLPLLVLFVLLAVMLLVFSLSPYKLTKLLKLGMFARPGMPNRAFLLVLGVVLLVLLLTVAVVLVVVLVERRWK